MPESLLRVLKVVLIAVAVVFVGFIACVPRSSSVRYDIVMPAHCPIGAIVKSDRCDCPNGMVEDHGRCVCDGRLSADGRHCEPKQAPPPRE